MVIFYGMGRIFGYESFFNVSIDLIKSKGEMELVKTGTIL